MSNTTETDRDGRPDIGEYCRSVEDYLTRANAGHLVRIVGPGFELVKRWAESGVPLSVVYRGIDLKADRHREGTATRPLRIEFCAGDVESVFDHWRRAVGLTAFTSSIDESPAGVSAEDGAPVAESPKKRSLTRHIDRAIDRLSRAAGRVEMPDGLRAASSQTLEALAALREKASRPRPSVRDEITAALGDLDAELAGAARQFAGPELMESIHREAETDLAPFRARLPVDAWDRSVAATVDRLLRDRFGLPILEV